MKKDTNRLIVIGNGFDLAHQLPTDYASFIYDLELNKIKKFGEALNDYSSEWDSDKDFFTYVLNKNTPNSISKNRTILNTFFKNNKGKRTELASFISFNSGEFNRYTKNSFLTQVINQNAINNWVDIEDLYYSQILGSMRGDQVRLTQSSVSYIKKINEGLEFISIKLEKYLIKETASVNHFSQMQKIFDKSVHFNKTIVLNFNYTNTFEKYCQGIDNCEIINIHGQLNDKDNPIIFGAGDENHSLYPKIVEMNNEELLQNVKSMKYLLNDNYKRLIVLLKERDYDVEIVGHSCGISDRTLLKEIFMNDLCKEINIYHHEGKKSFTSSVYGISRYFDNNVQMRKKVKDFDPNLVIPQFKG